MYLQHELATRVQSRIFGVVGKLITKKKRT